ncbi:MAG: hypothetical protein WBJ37_06170 [Bacteroidales bacterium]
MDKLEKFIKENRDKFDIYTPRGSVWRKIRSETGVRTFYWRVAAAVAVLITGLSVLYFVAKPEKSLTGSPSARELNETIVFYSVRFNELFNTAEPLLNTRPELRKELNADMERLDSIMNDIKKDLKDRVANSEVIEALIQNYRTRVMILEEMLDILKENEKENENDRDQRL